MIAKTINTVRLIAMVVVGGIAFIGIATFFSGISHQQDYLAKREAEQKALMVNSANHLEIARRTCPRYEQMNFITKWRSDLQWCDEIDWKE